MLVVRIFKWSERVFYGRGFPFALHLFLGHQIIWLQFVSRELLSLDVYFLEVKFLSSLNALQACAHFL